MRDKANPTRLRSVFFFTRPASCFDASLNVGPVVKTCGRSQLKPLDHPRRRGRRVFGPDKGLAADGCPRLVVTICVVYLTHSAEITIGHFGAITPRSWIGESCVPDEEEEINWLCPALISAPSGDHRETLMFAL